MLLRTRKGTRAETWTLRCGRPRQKSAEPLVLGIDRRLLRCLYCTMDRVEKLGTNISLAIAREASAAPQPPLREKLPGSNSTYPSTVPGTCSDRNTRESQKAPVVSVRMRATRLCSYRTIAIKQKRHTFSCTALLQPYAASPAGYPKSISSRTIFGDRERERVRLRQRQPLRAATPQRHNRRKPPHPLVGRSDVPSRGGCRVGRTVRCGWLSGASLTPFGAGAEKTCNRVELQKKKPRERHNHRLLPGRGSCGEMVWGM